MRREATRRTYNTSERAVARRAERVSKDIDTSVVDSDTRSGIATRAIAKPKRHSARTVGMAKVMVKDGYAGKAYGKGKLTSMGRAACGRPVLGVGYTEHVIKNCPKNTIVQQVEEDVPEILFIGNVQNKEALEGWKKMPMKVTLGDFVKNTPKVPIQKIILVGRAWQRTGSRCLRSTRQDEEEVVNVRQVRKQ